MYNERTKANTMKYMKEKRDKLTLDMPKGLKDKYKEYAKSKGKSLNGLIIELLDREISLDNSGEM